MKFQFMAKHILNKILDLFTLSHFCHFFRIRVSVILMHLIVKCENIEFIVYVIFLHNLERFQNWIFTENKKVSLQNWFYPGSFIFSWKTFRTWFWTLICHCLFDLKMSWGFLCRRKYHQTFFKEIFKWKVYVKLVWSSN